MSEHIIQRTIWALTLTSFMVALERSILAPLLPALAADFGTTVGVAGQAVTAYALPYGLFQLAYGPAGDRFGRLMVVRWAFLGFALGTLASAFAPTLPVLLLLRGFTGLCAAAMIPMALSFIGDSVPYAQRQGALGTLLGFTSLASAMSTAAGGLIGGIMSWRAVFVVYGAASLVIACGLTRLPMTRPTVAGPLPRYVDVLRIGAARRVYLTVFLEGVVLIGAFAYVGAHLQAVFGISYALVGVTLASYGVGSLLAGRQVGRLRSRFGERPLVLWGGLAITAGIGTIPLVPAWYAAIPPLLLLGVGFSLFHSTMQARATELVPHARGTAIAVFAFVLFVGGGIGSALFGLFAHDVAHDRSFVVASSIMLVTTLYALRRSGRSGELASSEGR